MSQSINAVRDGQEMSDPVEVILQRFPGPVTLNASRKRWAIMLVMTIGLCALAVYGLWLDQNPPLVIRISCWVILGMSVIGIPLAATLSVLPRASRLVIDKDGFEITQFFRSHRVLWSNAIGFQVYVPDYVSKSSGMVVFDDATKKGHSLALLSTSLAGRNSGIPDTYGLSAEELTSLMNEWRKRALK